MLTEEEGTIAVRLAREAVARALGGGLPGGPKAERPAPFRELRGAFVTWYEHPGHRLRGCIGYPQAILPLEEAIQEAAIAAALDDPRFLPVAARDLPSLVAEVSVLSPFEVVPPHDRPQGVTVGRDGLVVEEGWLRGLLLPQVATEQGWDREEFLDGACEKAGVPPGSWRSPQVKVYRFHAEVFRETSPGGDVVRAPLAP